MHIVKASCFSSRCASIHVHTPFRTASHICALLTYCTSKFHICICIFFHLRSTTKYFAYIFIKYKYLYKILLPAWSNASRYIAQELHIKYVCNVHTKHSFSPLRLAPKVFALIYHIFAKLLQLIHT